MVSFGGEQVLACNCQNLPMTSVSGYRASGVGVSQKTLSLIHRFFGNPAR